VENSLYSVDSDSKTLEFGFTPLPMISRTSYSNPSPNSISPWTDASSKSGSPLMSPLPSPPISAVLPRKIVENSRFEDTPFTPFPPSSMPNSTIDQSSQFQNIEQKRSSKIPVSPRNSSSISPRIPLPYSPSRQETIKSFNRQDFVSSLSLKRSGIPIKKNSRRAIVSYGSGPSWIPSPSNSLLNNEQEKPLINQRSGIVESEKVVSPMESYFEKVQLDYLSSIGHCHTGKREMETLDEEEEEGQRVVESDDEEKVWNDLRVEKLQSESVSDDEGFVIA
jgi:hypothetical protein